MSLKIQNLIKPFGSGFAAMSIKYVTDDLTRRYLRNIRDHIDLKVIKEKNDYYLFTKMPSESNEKYPSDIIDYDVIFQLSPPNGSSIENENIRDWDLKVYSNCPAFIYTFTYVYYQKGGLIRMPMGFYTRKAIKQAPKVRNPLLLFGIEKTLWFLVFYLDENKLFKKSNLDSMILTDKKFKDLIKDFKISSQDDKLNEVEKRSHKYSILNKNEDKLTSRDKKDLKKYTKEAKVSGKTLPKQVNISNLRKNMTSNLAGTLLNAENKKESNQSSLNKNTLKSSLNSKKR